MLVESEEGDAGDGLLVDAVLALLPAFFREPHSLKNLRVERAREAVSFDHPRGFQLFLALAVDLEELATVVDQIPAHLPERVRFVPARIRVEPVPKLLFHPGSKHVPHGKEHCGANSGGDDRQTNVINFHFASFQALDSADDTLVQKRK